MAILTPRSLTVNYNGLVRVISTPVKVSLPFDPNTSSVHPPTREYIGIWDTGATNSVITQKVVDEVGLIPTGTAMVNTASEDDVLTNTYFINILLLNDVGFIGVRVSLGKIVKADVLIGMDIISSGDFAITNKGHKTIFSFQVPSKEKIEFGKEISLSKDVPKVRRNQPCPCGSGKKYKQCHGKN